MFDDIRADVEAIIAANEAGKKERKGTPQAAGS